MITVVYSMVYNASYFYRPLLINGMISDMGNPFESPHLERQAGEEADEAISKAQEPVSKETNFTIPSVRQALETEAGPNEGGLVLKTESATDEDLDFPVVGEIPELPTDEAEQRLYRELELNHVFLNKDIEDFEQKLREMGLRDNVMNVVANWILGAVTASIVPTAMELAGKKIFDSAAEVKQKLDERRRKNENIIKEMRQITARRMQMGGAVYERKFDSDSQEFREELILTESQIEAERTEMERELATLAARAKDKQG